MSKNGYVILRINSPLHPFFEIANVVQVISIHHTLAEARSARDRYLNGLLAKRVVLEGEEKKEEGKKGKESKEAGEREEIAHRIYGMVGTLNDGMYEAEEAKLVIELGKMDACLVEQWRGW